MPHKIYQRTCEACGADYGSQRKHGRVCSLTCRDWINPRTNVTEVRWRQCPTCNRWYTHRGRKRLSDTCSRACGIAQRPPAASRRLPVLYAKKCAECGTPFTQTQPAALYCSPRCQRRYGCRRRRATHAGLSGTFSWTEFLALHIKLGKCCAYCNQPCDQPDPDHVIPVSRGGPNVLSNILPACRSCNSHKRDLTPAEWNTYRQAHNQDPIDITRFTHLALVDATPRAA